jgi:EmrB/QacA subfamily drug resistance transporter
MSISSSNSIVRYESPQGRWVLLATILGSGIASLDATVVNIALPTIERELGGGLATMQWTSTGYTLTLSAFLLLGGALGDRYGRKRVFLIGVVWFALSSALCGIAPSSEALIAARIVQGIGAALLTPGSLAILQASFHPDDRGRAIGAWTGWGGVAMAIGPFLGGYLIDAVSWRFIFLLNLPLAAWVCWLASEHVPETRDPSSKPIDWGGATFAVLGLGGATFAAIEAPSLHPASVVASLVAAGGCLAAFFWIERRSTHAILPLGIFQNPQFSGANLVTLLVYGALSGSIFLLPIQLQQVLHYSAFRSGLALLPVTVLMLLLSAQAGKLSQRLGPRLPMTLGPLVVAAGLALLARVSAGTGFVDALLPALIVFGLGLASTVAPLTATVLAAAPSEHAGIASAINNAVARSAGLLAVAALPIAAGLTGPAATDPGQFAVGFRIAMLLAAALCATGAIVAVGMIRNPDRPIPSSVRMHCALGGPPPSDEMKR